MAGYSFAHTPLSSVGAEVDFDLSRALNETQQEALRALLYVRAR